MVKGVHQQIIEVVSTENDCFDRVLLFIKPEKRNLSDKEKRREADQYVKRLMKGKQADAPSAPPPVREKKFPRRAVGALKMTGAAAAGAALAAFLIR